MIRISRWTFLFLISIGGTVACSGPAPISGPYSGLETRYEPGLPSFDAQVQPGISGSRRGIRVDVSAPEFSLVFARSDDELLARVEWLIRLLSADGKQVLEEQTRRQDIIHAGDIGPVLFRRVETNAFLESPPGRYRLQIQLEDLTSQKIETKEILYELPSRNQALIATELLLEKRDGTPLVALAFPDTMQSGKAVFHLTGNVSRPARINFSVALLDVDDSAARAPYWQGPGAGFSGISPGEYSVLDTLYKENRIVRRGALRRVEFDLPQTSVGAFRVEVSIDDLSTEGEEPALRLTRYFLVRNASFPRLESFPALIEPLVYLADASEWEVLRDSSNVREQFDAFWGRFMADRDVASNIVRRYFSRVEEANLRYSDFREGWKTDRGMIYIILGEPLFIEQNLESEVWYYSYGGERGEHSFVFHRIHRRNTPAVVQEFKLERSFGYERFWRGEIDRWRRGLE